MISRRSSAISMATSLALFGCRRGGIVSENLGSDTNLMQRGGKEKNKKQNLVNSIEYQKIDWIKFKD